jgi:glutamate/tyrosine decarboxylase-like PLP-dependent enzyme
MSLSASYISFSAEARDQINWNPEWSRRARGFPVYAAMRQLGREGIANLVENCCTHARALAERIGSLPGAELVCQPTLNQGLVRFPDPAPNASETDHTRYTNEIIAAINATGEAFFTGSTWKGRRVMRISVVNWRTSPSDVDRAVTAVSGILHQNSKTNSANI